MDPSTAVLVVATFVGAVVQAATGFGFAIIAAPVFLGVIGTTAAVPVLVGLHVVQSALLVPRVWQLAPLPHLSWLGAGAAVGCPLGLVLLEMLSLVALKIGLGLLLLVFAALFGVRDRWGRGRPIQLGLPQTSGLTSLTGFASGFLTSVLVMPGPPLMLYYANGNWPKDAARGLSLTFFAGCYVFVLALAAGRGLINSSGWVSIVGLSPVVLIGTLAGSAVGGRLSERQYRGALLALMIISGVGAVISAF